MFLPTPIYILYTLSLQTEYIIMYFVPVVLLD